MMREYKTAKGWAIFIYVTAPLLIALFCWPLLMPFVPSLSENTNPDLYWFLIPLSVLMIGLMIVGLIDTYKGRFVIDNEKVFTINAFSYRELRFQEIKGYRINEKYIFIEPKNENKKRIKVSTYFGKTNEIIEWLSEHYSDLDVVQTIQERDEILKNEEFGWTEEQRAEKLKTAQKTAKVLNWTGGLIGAWTLFQPNPYEYAISLSIVFPVVCLIVLKYFKGLIRIDEKKDTAYPTIYWAIFSASAAICLRGLFDFDIFDYSKVWAPTISITVVYTAILIVGNSEFKFSKAKDLGVIIAFIVFNFGYSYGTVVTLNCFYDKTEPEIFGATVLDKRVSSGKSTTYYVELTPWGPQREVDEVSVSKYLYNRLEKNDPVKIYFKKGLFNISWFEVTE